MTVFLKTAAADYLDGLLGSYIQDAYTNPQGYEVDPDKYKGNLKANMERLYLVSQRLFDDIMNSADKLPLSVRQAFLNLRKLVYEVFPQHEFLAIGGFVFLRFIAPALLAPESFGLMKAAPSLEVRRSLCLLGKMIQNTANKTYFNEPFMQDFNEFVDTNKERCVGFCEKISTLPPNEVLSSVAMTHLATSVDASSSRGDDETEDKIQEMAILVRLLNTNLRKVELQLQNDPRLKQQAEKAASSKKLMDELKQLLQA